MSSGNSLQDDARKVLKSAWQEVMRIPAPELETKHFLNEEQLRATITELVTARTKAFRYATLTQTLAKATQHDLNCLALQKGADLSGAFDARSLCKNVVTEFERQHFPNALGGSDDPYVSKPLRRPRISLEADVLREIKHKEEWRKLHALLNEIEERNDSKFTQRVLKQILLEIRKRISEQLPALPDKITAEEIRAILAEYLARSTLGLGPQAVAYSLLKVFNKRTGAYQEVTSRSPTAADAPAGRIADIECTDADGALRLAVCVTHKLDNQKLEQDLRKCKESGVANVLFLGSDITLASEQAYKLAANYGVNATIIALPDFVLAITALLNGEMRRELIQVISEVLRTWGGMSAATEFNEIVRKILRPVEQ